MTSSKKDPVLVVLQLSGAYDALNTIIPYNDPHYKDFRTVLKVEPEEVLAIDNNVGFHPSMAPIKNLYDQGKVAVIQGIGYPNPIRSHFRSMDIWHTAAPEKMGMDGWLGRAIGDMDPHKENVLTGVNFGRGLPRALATSGVSVASVGGLDQLGVDRNRGPESADRGIGHICPNVLTNDRLRRNQRLSVTDRVGRIERCGHPSNCANGIHLHGGVWRRPILPVAEERGPGASGRSWLAGALYRTEPWCF